MKYDVESNSNTILGIHGDERFPVATAQDYVSARVAAGLLDEAQFLNDHKHQYTKAARTIAKAESVDGFRWIPPYGGRA